MHYFDGQPAKVGDLIIADDNGRQIVGILTGANPQSETCNGNIHVIAQRDKSQLGLGHWLPITASSHTWMITLSKSVCVDFENLSEFSESKTQTA